MLKKPAKCTTPKRDRESYRLTASDMRNLNKLIGEANEILSYYINMPENLTGELSTLQFDGLTKLCEAVEDLKTTLDEIVWE